MTDLLDKRTLLYDYYMPPKDEDRLRSGDFNVLLTRGQEYAELVEYFYVLMAVNGEHRYTHALTKVDSAKKVADLSDITTLVFKELESIQYVSELAVVSTRRRKVIHKDIADIFRETMPVDMQPSKKLIAFTVVTDKEYRSTTCVKDLLTVFNLSKKDRFSIEEGVTIESFF